MMTKWVNRVGLHQWNVQEFKKKALMAPNNKYNDTNVMFLMFKKRKEKKRTIFIK